MTDIIRCKFSQHICSVFIPNSWSEKWFLVPFQRDEQITSEKHSYIFNTNKGEHQIKGSIDSNHQKFQTRTIFAEGKDLFITDHSYFYQKMNDLKEDWEKSSTTIFHFQSHFSNWSNPKTSLKQSTFFHTNFNNIFQEFRSVVLLFDWHKDV